MKIRIKEEVDTTETLVEILCKRVNEDIMQLERYIQLFSKTLIAKENGEYIQVAAGDIYYIESIDQKHLSIQKTQPCKLTFVYMNWKTDLRTVLLCVFQNQ